MNLQSVNNVNRFIDSVYKVSCTELDFKFTSFICELLLIRESSLMCNVSDVEVNDILHYICLQRLYDRNM